ncbi:MAG TPA: hypothetical protein VIK86_05660 [Candidatus Paceibacterota bacterium]
MIYDWEHYYENYYYTHQKDARRNMQKYLDKMRTAIIYKILDENADIKYFGSTDSIFRLNFHNNGFGKLDLKHNYGKIMFSEIENVTRGELYFIEFYLIHKYKPKENSERKNLWEFEFPDERKIELMEVANNLKFNLFT